ncbi:MAG: transglutaminase-like domain-containing protein [Planctomycetota bacterium]
MVARVAFLLCLVSLVPTVALADDSEPLRLPFQLSDVPFGEEWFAVYTAGRKIGAYSITHVRDGDEIRLRMTTRIRSMSAGETQDYWDVRTKTFSGKPPYTLVAGTVLVRRGAETRRIRIQRAGDELVAKIVEGGQVRTRRAPAPKYSFTDYIAPLMWMRTPTKLRSKKIRARAFHLEAMEEDFEVSEFLRASKVDGVDEKVLDFTVTMETRKTSSRIRVDSKGKLLWSRFGVFEMRSEPKELANDFEHTVDFFALGKCKVDQKLGIPPLLKKLVLEVPSEIADGLAEGPRQRVVRKGKVAHVVLGEGGVDVPVTADDRRKALRETTYYPIQHPKVKTLAKEALRGITKPEKQVKRLVEYVHLFLRYDLNAEPLTVLSIIEKRRGDCTEFSDLFVALARCAGIPARRIGGLSYMGDRHQTFGGHAWCEVALEGKWVPVDPTSGQTTIDVGHIAFDEKDDGTSLANASKHGFKVIERE